MKRRLFASLIGIVLVAAVAIGFTVGSGDRPSLGLDLQGGASITLQPEGEYDALALDVAVEIIRSRVDAIGVAEPEIIRQGDTVVVNLPGVKDQQRALDIVGRTGDLQLRPVLQSGSVDPTGGTGDTGTGNTDPVDTTVPEEGGPGEARGARPNGGHNGANHRHDGADYRHHCGCHRYDGASPGCGANRRHRRRGICRSHHRERSAGRFRGAPWS
ncbi:MAG: protein translocase subunit SecD [Actinomycetota bacterium]